MICFKKLTNLPIAVLAGLMMQCAFSNHCEAQSLRKKATDHPKIVNIVNFIRLLEPRDSTITEDILYQTVVKQVQMMQKYKLGGTFLLQYDALMDPRYQRLLKTLPRNTFEIGAWWEIPQPMVEKAGLKWRGRYPWDWRANIGFSTGYTPAEREKLADVYMKDFKHIFGYYPKSVASWFIDAHTLNYLYQKYHIVASANCKDQYGTDGYTLWGGYWNQAYYPSKVNAYMPAQHAANQIPVPIFRMLGSDPIRQYDNGLGSTRQGVITLEPVYPKAGGDSTWVDWFFKEFVAGASMQFAYTQAGQENSFTWDAMAKGFELQMPLIASLRNQHKIKVETLGQSGAWFRKTYPLTPATSVTITHDIKGSNRQTVWFDSRYYRANLLWENNTLKFRDIHLFNENLRSVYETKPATSNECTFFTLPMVDGYVWSKGGKVAGLKLKAIKEGKEITLEGGKVAVDDHIPGKLNISWPLTSFDAALHIELDDRHITITIKGHDHFDWYLDLETGTQAKLPFTEIKPSTINARFEGMDYKLTAQKGAFSQPANGAAFRITPAANAIILKL